MGFIQPCFIENVDNDVIGRLKELGYWYCQNGYGEWYIPIEHCHYIECGYNGKAYFMGRVCKPSNSFIDCGKNKELFFAIAALSNDIDKNQWFTDGIHWEKCPYEIAHLSPWIDKYKSKPHKATVQELIEHFKEK